jgi:hypothetical protein
LTRSETHILQFQVILIFVKMDLMIGKVYAEF